MENSDYTDMLQHNSKLLTTLLDVSNLVTSTMELRPLLEAILDKLRTIIEYRDAKIFISEGDYVRVIAHRSSLQPEQERSYPLPLGRETLMGRKAVVIGDLRSDDEQAVLFRKNMHKYMETVFRDVRCWMSLPMVYKDTVIGILTLDHPEPGFYSNYHVELGSAFANQAAIEYENAKLYNEMVKRADEVRTLFSIQQAITSRLELDSVLRLIAGEARRLSHADSTAVFLLDGEELAPSVFSGVVPKEQTDLRIPVKGSAMGESLSRHVSVILKKECIECQQERKLIESISMNTCLLVPLMASSRAVGIIAAFSRSETEFDSEDERIFNMFAPSAVIGIENARLYGEEKRRHQENEQRRRVAEGLKDILRALNSNRSLEDILGFIIREAVRLLHADAAALFRLNDDRITLSIVASFGLPHLESVDSAQKVRADILRNAFIERRPIVKTDIAQAKLPTNVHPVMDVHMQWLRDNCSKMTAVPLICRDEVYGGITLYFRRDGNGAESTISKEDISLAMSFADQAALAIENTRLKQQAEETAVTAERNRLARDLHDAVTQTLFSASLIAEVVPRIWDRNRDEGMKRLEELKQLTRGALAEMRTLLFELRPATLVEAPLEDLLRQLGEAVTGRARIPVKLDIKGTVNLPSEMKITFYRVAQEALNNISKHSGARNAILEYSANEDAQLGIIVANLYITDDGKGFDPHNIDSGHFGLGIMRERAEAAGAKLSIATETGKGTRIGLEWVGSRQSQ
jgi:signal transduction histidine kinase/putative methionine-R-sulfoxide reductase with GAF domain